MGRSRGGLTTKIHALVDANGLPILLKLTPGQAHDGKSAEGMLDALGAGLSLASPIHRRKAINPGDGAVRSLRGNNSQRIFGHKTATALLLKMR